MKSSEIGEFTLPKNIKEELKKNVVEIKNIMKNDSMTLSKVIEGLHDLNKGKGYIDTFCHHFDNKYPHNYKLVLALSELSFFITAEHELTKEIIKNNYPLDEIFVSNVVAQEIDDIFLIGDIN